MKTPRLNSAERYAQQYREIANRLSEIAGTGPVADQWRKTKPHMRQAGAMLVNAVRREWVRGEFQWRKWMERVLSGEEVPCVDAPALFREAHVRILVAFIDIFLLRQHEPLVREQPGGLGWFKEDGPTEEERSVVLEGRLHTLADACRWIADEITGSIDLGPGGGPAVLTPAEACCKLASIASELRELPRRKMFRWQLPDLGGRLVGAAFRLGAFDSPEHQTLHAFLQVCLVWPLEKGNPHPFLSAWAEATSTARRLLGIRARPSMHPDDFDQDCERVASLIERAARKGFTTRVHIALPSVGGGWTKSALCREGGIHPSTFSRIRKAAKVKPPASGVHGYLFDARDVARMADVAERTPGKREWETAAKCWRQLLNPASQNG